MIISTDNFDMPLQLEESTADKIPLHLENIVASVEDQFFGTDNCASALLTSLLYTAVMECGFTPVNKEDDGSSRNIVSSSVLSDDFNIVRMRQFNKFPKCWNEEQKTYILDFVLASVTDCNYCLTVSCLTRSVCVAHFFIREIHDDSSHKFLQLKVEEYIPNPHSSHIFNKFQNLKSFSMRVKNDLIFPVKCTLLSLKCPSSNLAGIPEELILRILKQLKVCDLLRMAQTCHRFREMCQSPKLWLLLLNRDFPGKLNGTDKTNFEALKTRYKTCYKDLKLSQRRFPTSRLPLRFAPPWYELI